MKIAHIIGKAGRDQGGDIRDVISIGKLVRKNDGPEEVGQMLATMIKYGEIKNNHSNRTSDWLGNLREKEAMTTNRSGNSVALKSKY